MSGVKNFVSNAGALLRGAPFNQVKSPKAKGVSLSTPSVASGDCSPSGTDWVAAAAGFSDEGAELSGVVSVRSAAVNEDVTDPEVRGTGVSAGAVAGVAASAGANGLDTSLGTFITMSLRVALPATTVTEGNATSGCPSTCAVTAYVPGARSENE